MPIIGVITWIGMTYLTRFPHIFNYTTEVTEHNAKRLYTIGTRTVTIMKMLVCLLLSTTTILFTNSAIANHSNIDLIAIVAFLILITITPVLVILCRFLDKAGLTREKVIHLCQALISRLKPQCICQVYLLSLSLPQ